MDATLTAPRVAPKSSILWTGRILSALPALLMIFSAYVKLTHNPQAVQGLGALGLGPDSLTVIGIIELSCVAIYLIPPTAALGAILIAAYLGGAVLAHMIMHQPVWAPVLTAVVAWVGLYLREPRLRALFPLQKQ